MSIIRALRKDVLGMSQAELAAAAGVKQSTVSRWERGELSPSLDEVSRIIEASDGKVTANDFLAPRAAS